MYNYSPIFILAPAFVAVHGSTIYDVLPRDANTLGGFALRADNCTNSGSYCTNTIARFDVCCPESLTCLTGHAEHCCPTQSDCITALNTTPQCADTSWTLCGSDDNYFCCLAGTTCYATTIDSTRAVACLPAGETLAAGQTAVQTVSPSRETTSSSSSTTQTSRSTTTTSSISLTSDTTSHTPATGSPSSTSANAPSQSTAPSGASSGFDTSTIVNILLEVLGVLVAIVAAVFAYLQWKNRDLREHGLQQFPAAQSIRRYFRRRVVEEEEIEMRDPGSDE